MGFSRDLNAGYRSRDCVTPLTFPGLWTIPQLAVRSAIMFSAGALMYQWRDTIPANWSLVAVSVAIVLAANRLPDYRVVGALPLAYAVIVSGALLQGRRLRLHTDLSYGVYIYAFPIQRLLAVCGLSHLQPVLFFLVAATATLPLAAASWFFIEKPSMSSNGAYAASGPPPSPPAPRSRPSQQSRRHWRPARSGLSETA